MSNQLTKHQKLVIMQVRFHLLNAVYHQNKELFCQGVEALLLAGISLEGLKPILEDILEVISKWRAKTEIDWEDDYFIKASWITSAIEEAKDRLNNALESITRRAQEN